MHRASPARVVAITREVESCVRANHTEYGLGCEHGKGGVGGMAWASGSRAKYRGGSSCKAHRCPLGSRPRLAAPRHEFWPGLVVLPKMWNRSFLTKLCGNILCKPEHRLCKWCPGSPPLPCSQPRFLTSAGRTAPDTDGHTDTHAHNKGRGCLEHPLLLELELKLARRCCGVAIPVSPHGRMNFYELL